MDSILNTNKGHCFICGRICATHKHHIFGASNRSNSENLGLWVYLCPECHNMSNRGVHNNRKNDLMLKKIAQREFEKTHTREQFISIIGRNYLDD